MRNDINTATTNVRRAGFDDLTGAAGVLAAAFQDDPVFTWCLPDATRRAAILPTFFRIVANAIAVHDGIHVAADGAARSRRHRWRGLRLPPGPPVGDLESPSAELLGDDAGRTFDLVGLLDAAHPHAPHDYLWFVGVGPGAQGRGIGGACSATGSTGPAYLVATSKDNRRLFERHGFEVVNELRVGTSPTLWAMWREPEAANLMGDVGAPSDRSRGRAGAPRRAGGAGGHRHGDRARRRRQVTTRR